jgi:hypothetical protein
MEYLNGLANAVELAAGRSRGSSASIAMPITPNARLIVALLGA